MPCDWLTLLLPVLWAVIATLIGLALYKTSKALFESQKSNTTASRRIRLTGSVTIAALAFYGMKWATPPQRLQAIPEGAIVVKANDLGKLYDLSTELDRSSIQLEGCTSTLSVADCKEEIRRVRNQTVSMNETLLRTLKGGASIGEENRAK
jgi:hypothetical protein